MAHRWIAISLLLLAAVGCTGKAPRQDAPRPIIAPEGTIPAEPLSARGNQSPYRVLGRTYHVLPTSHGYVQEGIASWYGEPFHGRPTSNQETFDMHQLTAAHKTLPLPTYARVTNRANGKSVVVRVNDRGPFKDDRIIDLSFAAARALDMIDSGTAMVEVRALVPDDAEFNRPLVVSAEHLYLQLGAFAERANALALMQQLRNRELPPAEVISSRVEEAVVHRVRLGPLASAEEADELTARLLLLGLDRPVVIFE